MRRRLLVALVVVAVATVAVLGIPLAILGRAAARNDAVQRADRHADSIGFAVIARLNSGGQVDAALLAPFASGGRYIEVVEPDGRTTTAGSEPIDDTVGAEIDVGDGLTVRVIVPDDEVAGRQALVAGVVAGLAALAVGAAALVGVVLAHRLNRPLDQLADAARRLGDGDLSARAAPTGVSEVDAVGETLNQGAQRIEQVVAAERRFSANASHQLRTPLSALRLRLEEIAAIGDDAVRIEADAALGQADRLDDTIDELLRLARDGAAGPATAIEVGALVRHAASGWRSLADRAGRRLDIEAPHNAGRTRVRRPSGTSSTRSSTTPCATAPPPSPSRSPATTSPHAST